MDWLNPFTIACLAWVAWLATWLIAALFAKRSRWSEGRFGRLQYGLPVGLGFFLIFHKRPGHIIVGPLYNNRLVEWIGTAMTIVGLAFSVWARSALGRNWSGIITLKQGHRLITTGPYRLARHPIYTGFLTAVLGTALAVGTGDALIGFVGVVVGFLIKMRREETLMIQEFGDEYREFKKRVAALVPFIY
jgi:protein-S-isoprenylcysteine O-methyltransferase Ste14